MEETLSQRIKYRPIPAINDTIPFWHCKRNTVHNRNARNCGSLQIPLSGTMYVCIALFTGNAF